MKLNRVLCNPSLPKLLDEVGGSKLDQYAKFKPSPLSIAKFVNSGRNSTGTSSFLFLRKEIPVRLANIIKELDLLPSNLQQQSSYIQIQDQHAQSFQDLLQFEHKDITDEVQTSFAATLANVRLRYMDTVPLMAEAVRMMNMEKKKEKPNACIQYFLDRLYMSRISVQMMINQHLQLYGEDLAPSLNHVGCIDPYLDVTKVVQDAFQDATFVCESCYMDAPKLNLKVVNKTDAISSIQLSYIPSHLFHILFELFKNAMRSTVEKHSDAERLPTINCLVVKSSRDITIKVSDQGGGLPRRNIQKLFHYGESTADSNARVDGTIMAGLGYGLPMSRLLARYLCGDLTLNSVDGYGTDATVYLKACEEDAREVVPVLSKVAKHHYKQLGKVQKDWTQDRKI